MATTATMIQSSARCAMMTPRTHRGSAGRGTKTELQRPCCRVRAAIIGGEEDRDNRGKNAIATTTTTTSQQTSRRGALGGLIATPLVLPGILSAASVMSASAGPASAAAASELESEITSKVFFDFAVDSKPVGRVVVGVFGKANPVAAARFASLAVGVQGLSYKRTEVNAVEYNGKEGGSGCAQAPFVFTTPRYQLYNSLGGGRRCIFLLLSLQPTTTASTQPFTFEGNSARRPCVKHE